MGKERNVADKIDKKLARVEFINKHKLNAIDFTRDRVLNFVVVFMLILRNSVKSIQLTLNEIFSQGFIDTAVSSSAYTQARKKFKHTAFIELNDDVIDIYYADNAIKRWKGYRCLGVDGSKIILPNTKEIKETFGSIRIKNQTSMEGTYAAALFECCYDVLNRIAIAGVLAHCLSYEVDLAVELLSATKEDDLLIYDRCYASYKFLSILTKGNKNYIIRCSTSSFKETIGLFDGSEKNWSKVVTLAGSRNKKTLIENELPQEIQVRFVSVILSTGEIEVLATSIMSEKFSRDDFKEAYNLRWGIEGYFHVLKERLCLENFTGKTLESVRQDFWSTIFISNVETVFTENAKDKMQAKNHGGNHETKVNKAVAFNAIKNMAFDIFLNTKDRETLFEKLDVLFMMSPTLKRPGRNRPRDKRSSKQAYNFLKRLKKQIF